MKEAVWCRSRYWLCHFLHSRHEREPTSWTVPPAGGPSPAGASLRRWIAGVPRRSQESGAWLVATAARECADDPAYVQCVRLLVKEQHHHDELLRRLLERLGVALPSRPRHVGPIRRLAGWRRSTLGSRFEMSVLLLIDCIDLLMLTRLAQTSDDPVVREVAAAITKEKRGHIGFCGERLTALYADFNFLRRNLRRLRLRSMWMGLLLGTSWRHARLLGIIGRRRRDFVAGGRRHFDALLERMVPYRRDAVLRALRAQRSAPYAKATLP